jgi:hypothetical protein
MKLRLKPHPANIEQKETNLKKPIKVKGKN